MGGDMNRAGVEGHLLKLARRRVPKIELIF